MNKMTDEQLARHSEQLMNLMTMATVQYLQDHPEIIDDLANIIATTHTVLLAETTALTIAHSTDFMPSDSEIDVATGLVFDAFYHATKESIKELEKLDDNMDEFFDKKKVEN